jgi:Predicted O-methyltransferase
MSPKTINIDEKLYEYLLNNTLREPELLKKPREETALMSSGLMQISPEEGQFMGLLIRLIGIRRILEIGVFTGYSSLAMALAHPEDGTIIACDISEEYTRTERKYWKESNVDTRIKLKIGPATDILQELSQDDKLEPFDLVFIYADKGDYSNYYEAGLSLLRKGGLIWWTMFFGAGRLPTRIIKRMIRLPSVNSIKNSIRTIGSISACFPSEMNSPSPTSAELFFS